MKYVYYIVLSILICVTSMYSFDVSASNIVHYNKIQSLHNILNDTIPDEQSVNMDDWDDERLKRYEDSIKSVLYPQPIERERERPMDDDEETYEIMTTSSGSISSIENSHVPDYAYVNTQKAVGEIKIESSLTPSGARSYNVPIDICAGNGGFVPKLALSYNSQGRNGIIGMGWNIAGLSMISRCTKSIYYDGKTQSIQMDKSDAFTLDGTRLIKISEESDGYVYKTEVGNVKVKAYLNGTTVKYFKVFYPDGAIGVFGYTSNSSDKLFYPVVELTDARGNIINFTYTYANNRYAIKNIQYNGAAIEFNYTTTRPDPLISYNAGQKIMENSLLQSIVCKLDSEVLGTYTLTYINQNDMSLLQQIDYTAGNSSYNPLKFYYGEGSIYPRVESSKTNLIRWYEYTEPNSIKAVKGKFYYYNGSDGIITFPNNNPYWKHHRDSGLTHHSENRFDNGYKGDEKIFLYAGLTGNWVDPLQNLVTEEGFIDVLCADLDGQQEECVIKINNKVVNDKDQVTFKVYKGNIIQGMMLRYTRTFSFSTVHKDAKGDKSIQPKFYYTGDFNGDGKMEILAISCHQPFGDTDKPSKCYIFDLNSNKIIYENSLLVHNVEFVGSQQGNIQTAENNSDKIFIIDYDGDGKSDICHVNANGTDVYTFDVSGTVWTAKKIGTYSSLRRSIVANKQLLVAELNGDGLSDLLLTPEVGSDSEQWNAYESKGNGSFENIIMKGPKNSKDAYSGFYIQDLNGDGITDLIQGSRYSFSTYVTKNNNMVYDDFELLPNDSSIIVPTSLNSHNKFTQLISLNNGIATRYSFKRNVLKDVLATGMINSLGIIERNDYMFINADDMKDGRYTSGSGAAFPFVNVAEPIAVLAVEEKMTSNRLIDRNKYKYHNAVVHRQGLGFCGFEEITSENLKGQLYRRTFAPYNFGVLKEEDSEQIHNTYSYDVKILSGKERQVLLTQKTERNKLTNIEKTSSYGYDSYGYMTKEAATCTGDIDITTLKTYRHNTSIDNGYCLGMMSSEKTTITRDGKTCIKELTIPAYTNKFLPVAKVNRINGNAVSQESYTYDTTGNPLTISTKNFSAPEWLVTTNEYDSYGRIIKKTDALGRSAIFTYNEKGLVATKKDFRDGITTYSYDDFGRVINTGYPDNTTRSITYSWSSEGTGGLYKISEEATNAPMAYKVYDAVNREVRTSVRNVSGSSPVVDKQYDEYGKLQKQSLPYVSYNSPLWTEYNYDSYGRISFVTEASGKRTTYSYYDNTVTVTKDGIASTTAFDALGNIIEVTDPAGTITYHLGADGKPEAITAPGNVTTNIDYDNSRRRISIDDPSRGITSYEYDSSGNMVKETDANENVITYEYDSYGRITSKKMPEFTTTYTYNEYGDLTDVSSSNNTSKAFSYDALGRLSLTKETTGETFLQKKYEYSDGNISSIGFTSHKGFLGTEKYKYSNGHLKEVLFNDKSISRISSVNEMGRPTSVYSGIVNREYKYNQYGHLTDIIASKSLSSPVQNVSYTTDVNTNNITSRTDNIRDITEEFTYDNLNRLSAFGDYEVTYGNNGNILSKSDVGTMSYDNDDKPYAITGMTQIDNTVPAWEQTIEYTSFHRPKNISENNWHILFAYNGNGDRAMALKYKGPLTSIVWKYYIDNRYEAEVKSSKTTERLYLGGDYYTAPAVLVSDGNESKIYYILRDNLGSITHILDSNGTLVQELSYDAWGRLRNPDTRQVYAEGEEPELFLGRGYCGHEHLPEFGLINMNARLYDPVLGRFLSPDPFVQAPDFTQSLNRYSYCMNNPLRYVDKDGESITLAIICGAVIGGYLWGAAANHGELNPFKWDYSSATTYLGIGFGAIIGAVGGYGLVCPGEITFCGMISSPYASIGATAFACGNSTGWKFNYHWSTSAGGQWNSYDNAVIQNVDDAINEAIEENSNFQDNKFLTYSYMYSKSVNTEFLGNESNQQFYDLTRRTTGFTQEYLDYMKKSNQLTTPGHVALRGNEITNGVLVFDELYRDFVDDGMIVGFNTQRDIYKEIGSMLGGAMGAYIGWRRHLGAAQTATLSAAWSEALGNYAEGLYLNNYFSGVGNVPDPYYLNKYNNYGWNGFPY